MTTPTHERIAVFTRSSFTKTGAFQGISFNASHYMRAIKWGRYQPRPEVETNPKWLQVVCYVIVECNGKVLRYQRGKRGEESRLHNLYSVGIGGHINDKDGGYLGGFKRELEEELTGFEFREEWRKDNCHKPVACLYDPSTDVGAVHFGFVHVLSVSSKEVASHCASIVNPHFWDVEYLADDQNESPHLYESWSQICLQNIGTILEKAK